MFRVGLHWRFDVALYFGYFGFRSFTDSDAAYVSLAEKSGLYIVDLITVS